jgi:chromate transport protein ChrA
VKLDVRFASFAMSVPAQTLCSPTAGIGTELLAFPRTALVDRLRWLTAAHLLDAVAVSQVTRGPVFTTATSIGYILGGFRGRVT